MPFDAKGSISVLDPRVEGYRHTIDPVQGDFTLRKGFAAATTRILRGIYVQSIPDVHKGAGRLGIQQPGGTGTYLVTLPDGARPSSLESGVVTAAQALEELEDVRQPDQRIHAFHPVAIVDFRTVHEIQQNKWNRDRERVPQQIFPFVHLPGDSNDFVIGAVDVPDRAYLELTLEPYDPNIVYVNGKPVEFPTR